MIVLTLFSLLTALSVLPGLKAGSFFGDVHPRFQPHRRLLGRNATIQRRNIQPAVLTRDLPEHWEHQYCLAEPDGGRIFQHQITWEHTNTVQACLTRCEEYGYSAAGLHNGQDCWCGDAEDIANNGGTEAPPEECHMACTGDATGVCGGPSTHTYYKRALPITIFQTPADVGRYEFYVPGVVVPLMATVQINGKLTFLEKPGVGNSTGAYELDPSLIGGPTWEDAWRTMHVKTDVFCSTSLVLPDKAGRQINVGGWSDESLYGIRLFTPTGALGQPSTSDWQEDVNTLRLQRPRWYASAVVLANGSVAVLGGETTNSGPPQPNMEIVPRIPGGDTTVSFQWLIDTYPYNLYPFMFVLPSSNVLVVYHNEARILDKTTFDTVTTLPKLPAAVNSFDGGRTYPFSGSAMLLPQKAPYTDPVQVLVCGGATQELVGIDTCVTIAPEVPGANWVVERMPSKRVMSCMANLPDGTFMILNGAQQGVSGFASASDPNYKAVLYDPSLPVNQRMTELGSTIVARLYHSEVVLLPDASVLVSGSDPLDPNFPEEYRFERYIPSYLTSGLERPSFTLSATEWAYNGLYTVVVKRALTGLTNSLRVSLIAASSSTHGNTMGARTIFPDTKCLGLVCTVTAPPNAGICPPGWFMLFVLDGPTPSVAQWVRIGGDPAQLGNWPPGDEFTRPGV